MAGYGKIDYDATGSEDRGNSLSEETRDEKILQVVYSAVKETDGRR